MAVQKKAEKGSPFKETSAFYHFCENKYIKISFLIKDLYEPKRLC